MGKTIQVTDELRVVQVEPYIWEIPPYGEMRVPGRIYGDRETVDHLVADVKAGKSWNALLQIVNVACLPGIQKASLAMADVHPGYGFPIGGVGAFDFDEGVISMAGVGYDINCLAGESRVLHAHGYTRSIADMATCWEKETLRCQDFAADKETTTGIVRYLRVKPGHPVYRLVTEAGDEIIATADHPFWTPDGMVELCHLSTGDLVACYPFEGVPYETPPSKVIVSETDIEELLRSLGKGKRGHAASQILAQLHKRGLLPLRANSPQMPHLLKLLGYVLGDGSIYFTGGSGKGVTWFYGNADDLEGIRADVMAVGFTPSRVYSRTRQHHITTNYGDYQFEHEETSFKVMGSAFAILLAALGAPIGAKASQDYTLPDWLFGLPRWQQRLFLAAHFGAELSTPSAFPERNLNFQMPILSLNKREGYVQSGQVFLAGLSQLLTGFGVETKTISQRQEQTNPDGSVSHRLRLVLSSRAESLLALWGRVGFEYNRQRRVLANVAVQYLKRKTQVVEVREEVAALAVEMQAAGVTPQNIYADLTGQHVNRRFLERSLYSGRRSGVRVGAFCETFDEYRAEATAGLGNSGMIWARIAAIEPAKGMEDELVYDFTVAHDDHNFIAEGFVVSNCGVRTMSTNLTRDEIEPKKEDLANALYRTVPAGLGSTGAIKLNLKEVDKVLEKGAEFSVGRGYGFPEDLEYIEERGRITGADPDVVSLKAKKRQFKQIGTLGSGNHYLEVQWVEEIYAPDVADAYGLFPNQILISIHCGSRGLGHQIGTDYLKVLEAASRKYNIPIRERELVCAPIDSPEGRQYLAAVNCGINCAFANRQAIAHLTRRAFHDALGVRPQEIATLYEIGHNTAKVEEHEVDGQIKKLVVHRKGATRAFGPGRKELPAVYRAVGQPVLVGGTMGTCSFILHGTKRAMEDTFGSALHGAGRTLSRRQAKKQFWGGDVIAALAEQGIVIRAHSKAGVAEEAPGAYKDVEQVVEIMHNAGIIRKVARVRPLICIKG